MIRRRTKKSRLCSSSSPSSLKINHGKRCLATSRTNCAASMFLPQSSVLARTPLGFFAFFSQWDSIISRDLGLPFRLCACHPARISVRRASKSKWCPARRRKRTKIDAEDRYLHLKKHVHVGPKRKISHLRPEFKQSTFVNPGGQGGSCTAGPGAHAGSAYPPNEACADYT